MTIENLKVRSTDWKKVILTWEYGFTLEDLSLYKVTIYRGESEYAISGIDEVPTSVAYYEDDEIESFKDDKSFNFHYKLRLWSDVRDKFFETDVFIANQTHLNWVEHEVVRRDSILYDNFGDEFLWVKKKTVGPLCSCYNTTTGQKMRPGVCLECYDTTIVGGYYAPVLIKGKMGNYQTNAKMMKGGPLADSSTTFNMKNEPTLDTGDLIIDQRGNRWMIEMENDVRYKMDIVRQIFRISMADRSHAIYSIPIDFTLFSEYY